MQKTIKRRQPQQHDLSTSEYHPLLQRIYSARGIQSKHELERGLEKLLPYKTMLGIDQAVAILIDALKNEEKILIVGDFDADGATSTALAIRALRSFGAQHIDFLVPNRFAFGYGLTPELVDVAKKMEPKVIVTVDNGIANHAGVLAAKESGIKVVITDHHLPTHSLPSADAIVNPNQPNDEFPSKSIAGVGVIFYVMLALRRQLSDCQWFKEKNIPEPNMSRLLDLVALGTVADVVALDHNNRILVHQGLGRIRSGQCIPAITALLQLTNRNQAKLTAADLGFGIAPRLNAAGRLDDMSLGIACLLSDDLAQAKEMAEVLNQLNDERREIEQEMHTQAFQVLNKLQMNNTKSLPAGICLFDEEWHQGVIGILASRIKDRYSRPVIVFAAHSDTELKGSARSIASFHIRDALAAIATLHPELIIKFGGHAMAAGLTIPRSGFETFAKIFAEYVAKEIKADDLNHCLVSDGELPSDNLTLEIAEILRESGPWGQAFPEPLFDGVFNLVEQRLIGGKHLKMVLETENKIMDAIAFNIDMNVWPNYRCQKVKIAYRLDVNEFRGKRNVQLIIEHLETA